MLRTRKTDDEMTQSEHTKTPWIATISGKVMHGYMQGFAIAEYGQQNLIAGIFSDVRGGDGVAKANAALIVRAVNCHDELVSCLDAAIYQLPDRCETEREMGKMILAKARGEQ